MFHCSIKTHVPKVLTDSINKTDLGEWEFPELSVKMMNKSILDYVIRVAFEYPDVPDFGSAI